MKTKLHTAALITIITVIITGNLLAQEFDFNDESYINDIPFNTASIAADYTYNKAITVLFEMEDVTYIDDMPFNTEVVVENYAYKNAVMVEFQMNDEEYIDDIPFNTLTIADNYHKVETTNLYASEK